MPNKLRILMLEDSGADAVLMQRRIGHMAQLDVAVDGQHFREMLKEDWDVVIIDWHAGNIEGEEAARLSKEAHPDTPLILVTGSLHDDDAAAALRLGFVDYLRKDRLGRLEQAILEAHRNQLLVRQALRDNRLEILGYMTTGLMHDFNQILQIFMSGPELLRRAITDRLGEMPEPIGRVLDVMESTGQRGAEMSKQISMFVRGANGTSMKAIAPEFLLTELRRMLRDSFPHNIKVSTSAVAGTAMVRCDPVQVGQVLLNLAVNARDAMPEGGELSITAQNVMVDAGRRVQIQVHDTGTGIPPDVLPHIFDPFYTTKKVGEGTGLGLSMAQRIIVDHGGSMHVKTGSRGTSFIIYLPVAKEETHGEAVTRSGGDFDGAGKLVLICDDEAHMRSLIEMFLRDANYKVLTASNGMEALSYFRSNYNIDVLLTDVNMPHLSGESLLTSLRSQGHKLPIVFVTGEANAVASDFNPAPTAVLLKPFTRTALLTALHDVRSIAL
jgi:signal transduction histidine kinase